MLSPQEVRSRIFSEGMTQEEFASKLDVSQQVVSLWFKRDSIPSKYWARIKSVLNVREFREDNQKGELLSIKALAISAGASVCNEVDCIDEIPEYNFVIHRDGILNDSENLLAIPVSGTSMLPTIMPNEYVIIDKTINYYIGDGLYVLNFAGNLLVKRLQYDPSTNSLEIISDNRDYKNYKVNLSEDQSHLHIVGKVVTTIQR